MKRYTAEDVMCAGPVIPVIALDRIEDALPLAEALLAGGIRVLEITLRTDAALASIEKIAVHLPEAIVGAGTVVQREDLRKVEAAGAQFAISPGVTPDLLEGMKDVSIPLLPGVASASEIMLGMSYGLAHFKLFPAMVAGGIDALKAFGGPFAHVRFCPTGGIDQKNYRDFLALENVLCVGGSWLAPNDLIARGELDRITELARAVTQIS